MYLTSKEQALLENKLIDCIVSVMRNHATPIKIAGSPNPDSLNLELHYRTAKKILDGTALHVALAEMQEEAEERSIVNPLPPEVQ